MADPIYSPNRQEAPHNPKPETQILTVDELEFLPEGICITSQNPEDTGSEALGKFILGFLDEYPAERVPQYLADEVSRCARSPQYLIGQICARYSYGGIYAGIISAIDNEFPHLCWFRGGNYIETSSGSPALTSFLSSGANGYLGDTRALSYAHRDYNGNSHVMPVLYMVPFKKLINGVDSGIIDLGTEHDYDVVISLGSRNKSGFDQWALESVIVVDLGNSPKDFKSAESILKSKAVVLT